jgi:hypothetical protein
MREWCLFETTIMACSWKGWTKPQQISLKNAGNLAQIPIVYTPPPPPNKNIHQTARCIALTMLPTAKLNDIYSEAAWTIAVMSRHNPAFAWRGCRKTKVQPDLLLKLEGGIFQMRRRNANHYTRCAVNVYYFMQFVLFGGYTFFKSAVT